MIKVYKPSAFVSFDVELDGPNPMQFSMLSIGLAVFVEEHGTRPIDTFYTNIQARPGLKADEKTMEEFWNKRPILWKHVQQNAVPHQEAMQKLGHWLSSIHEKYTLKWVARPACVDWMWLKCYYESFGPPEKPDIGFQCQCIDTMLKTYFLVYPVRDKKDCTNKLANNLPYTHHALDDAIYQGTIYMNLRKIFNHTKYNFYE